VGIGVLFNMVFGQSIYFDEFFDFNTTPLDTLEELYALDICWDVEKESEKNEEPTNGGGLVNTGVRA
jgi:hypothetical protein